MRRPFISTKKFFHLSYLILIIIVLLTGAFTFLFAKILRSSEEDNLRQTGLQITRQIEQLIAQSESVIHNLSASQTLLDFLGTQYIPGVDFSYYNADIQDLFDACVGIDFRDSVKIYMENTSIPEGYGCFYHLDSLSDASYLSDFSSVSSVESVIYYNNELIHLAKLYSISGDFLGIVSVAIPQKNLWDTSVVREALFFDDTLILNFSERTEISSSVFSLRSSGLLYYCEDSVLLPFTLYFTDDISPSYILLYIFLCVFLLLIFLCVFLFYRQQRNGFLKTRHYLALMEHSLEQNMETRLEEDSQDEFSSISKYINLLLDKISLLIEKSVRQEAAQRKTQIQILQNQINPHFIYNTMEIFSSQMELYGHYEESDAMSAFANMLRYNIRLADHYALIREELDQIRNYIQLQKLRYPNLFVEFSVPGELLDKKIIRFILQPFIENSICHGMPEESYHLRIAVSAVCYDTHITFFIRDNGKGMSPQLAEELNRRFSSTAPYDDTSSSIGLYNINRRLQLFYGEIYSLKAEPLPRCGVCFSFSIPMDTHS